MKRVLSLLAALVLVFAAASACAGTADIHITEESGGVFKPLPINLDGGYKLPSYKYSKDIEVYEDPTIRVERHTVDMHADWLVTTYYAIIEIKDPSQIRTASADEANPFRSQAVKPAKAIAALKNAVFAVNGDYCAAFAGNKSTNYIMRQGTVYSESVEPSLDMLLIDEEGDFHILTSDQDLAAVDKTQVDGKKVINAFQFGPALVIDGEKVDDERINDKNHAPGYTQAKSGAAQRMCIAQIDTLHYLVLTCAHPGISLCRLRDLALTIAPCKVVYNLDGGNSAQMTFLHKKFNNVKAGSNKQRPITDIIYFASAWYYE